ncbi:MAG: hypothetical protein ACK4RK_20065 [Gemmataceae bacterium]
MSKRLWLVGLISAVLLSAVGRPGWAAKPRHGAAACCKSTSDKKNTYQVLLLKTGAHATIGLPATVVIQMIATKPGTVAEQGPWGVVLRRCQIVLASCSCCEIEEACQAEEACTVPSEQLRVHPCEVEVIPCLPQEVVVPADKKVGCCGSAKKCSKCDCPCASGECTCQPGCCEGCEVCDPKARAAKCSACDCPCPSADCTCPPDGCQGCENCGKSKTAKNEGGACPYLQKTPKTARPPRLQMEDIRRSVLEGMEKLQRAAKAYRKAERCRAAGDMIMAQCYYEIVRETCPGSRYDYMAAQRIAEMSLGQEQPATVDEDEEAVPETPQPDARRSNGVLDAAPAVRLMKKERPASCRETPGCDAACCDEMCRIAKQCVQACQSGDYEHAEELACQLADQMRRRHRDSRRATLPRRDYSGVVAELLDASRAAFENCCYEEAEAYAHQAAALDPHCVAAHALILKVQMFTHIKKQLDKCCPCPSSYEECHPEEEECDGPSSRCPIQNGRLWGYHIGVGALTGATSGASWLIGPPGACLIEMGTCNPADTAQRVIRTWYQCGTMTKDGDEEGIRCVHWQFGPFDCHWMQDQDGQISVEMNVTSPDYPRVIRFLIEDMPTLPFDTDAEETCEPF